MTKSYMWKLLKDGQFCDVEKHGHNYKEYKLDEGPFSTIEGAEWALSQYYKKYHEDYGDNTYCDFEEFVLLTIYSKDKWTN